MEGKLRQYNMKVTHALKIENPLNKQKRTFKDIIQ